MGFPLLTAVVISLAVPGAGTDLNKISGIYKLPADGAKLVLWTNRSFAYDRTVDGVEQSWPGHYSVSEKGLVFSFDSSSPFESSDLQAKLLDGKILIGGDSYVRLPRPLMTGTWVVVKDGKQNRSLKMIFGKDGTFKFVMPNATSKGKYLVDGDKLSLTWTEVDGSKVAPGSMKKSFSLADDGSWFKIDTFRYEKVS